jgi:uncharacterized Ntn-hydrolase superfamily protein
MSVNNHYQELSFDHLTEIREQNPFGKAEESDEHLSEPKEWTVSLSKLIAGLGLMEALVKVLEDNDLKEQRQVATIRRFIRIIA